jgi:hypothetical protein
MPNVHAAGSRSAGTSAKSSSFAHCLKESAGDSDKKDQTAITTRPQTSPKKAAANDKEPRRKKTDEALLNCPAETAPGQQILDPRSLLLSWRKAQDDAKDPGAKDLDKIGSAAQAETAGTVPQAGAAAVPNADVAFGVTVKQQAANNPPGGAANNTVATAVPAAGKPAEPDSQAGSDSKHQEKSKDKDSDASVSAVSKNALTANDGIAAAASAPKSDVLNTAAVHAVPTAYSHVEQVKSSAPVAPAATVAPIAEPPATPALRPHSIDIRVNGAGDSQVDVRVSQRAGDVEVTVRTPDTDLAQSLRQHLPELSSHLSQSGIHSDVWQPAAAQTSTGNGNTPDGEPGSRWQGQQQNQQQQQRQQEPESQQQRQRQANWFNEFNTAEKAEL